MNFNICDKISSGSKPFYYIESEKYQSQDWVAFMSQPYWVEVMVEVKLRLRLIWTWGWNKVEMRLSGSLVEIELRLSWVGVEISWHWIKEEIGLS